MLPGNQAEPGCQVPALAKCGSVADGSSKCSRSQRPNPRDSKQAPAAVLLLRRFGELAVDGFDLFFQLFPLAPKLHHQRSHAWRQQVISVFEDGRDLLAEVRGACSNRNTVLE